MINIHNKILKIEQKNLKITQKIEKNSKFNPIFQIFPLKHPKFSPRDNKTFKSRRKVSLREIY